jgi:hypothetical protein
MSFSMKEYINHFAALINSPPQIVLRATDFYDDFINEEGIAIAPMFSFQSSGV